MSSAALLLVLAGCRSRGELALEEAADAVPGFRLEITGNGSLGRTELLDAVADELRLFAADGLDRAEVDDLAYGVELHYRSRGFPDAYVDYELEQDESASRARLIVAEGPRVELAGIDLVGYEDPAYTEEELTRFFLPRATTLFGESRRWFVRTELEAGASALTSNYLARGYRDVKVSPPEVRFETDQDGTVRARATVRIEEGTRFLLTDVELELGEDGGPSLPPDARASVRRVHTDENGQPLPYTPRLVQEVRAQVLGRYADLGHPDCSVEVAPSFDAETGRVRVVYAVAPGPLVTIRDVVVRGNERTRTRFIRGRVTLGPGDAYDAREVRESFQRMFATRLFERVDISLGPAGDDPSVRDLIVEVAELPTLELYLEPGYGSYEAARVKLGARDRNLLGTGRSGSVEATLSGKYQRLVLGVTDPALFDSEVSGTIPVFYSRREEPSFTYDEVGTGLDLGTEWPGTDLETVIGYRFRSTDVLDVEVQSPLLSTFLEQIDISSIQLTLVHDTRDRLFVPESGSYTRARAEWADASLGSEVDFVAAGLEHARFYGLPWEGGVLGLGLDTGIIRPTGGNPLPLQVRLFNGGSNSVRSFEEDQLGPVDATGQPLGGEAYTVLSGELRQRIAGNFSGALFYDAGNVLSQYEDYLEFNGMRQGIGAGLRYLLPIGPVRIDAARNPDPGSGEDDWVVHFAVGLSF